MIAHILTTGNEVLLGDITDTNAGFLCRCLAEVGICVDRITAVKDDVAAISRALEQIAGQAEALPYHRRSRADPWTT